MLLKILQQIKYNKMSFKSVNKIQELYKSGKKIVALTSYTVPFAIAADGICDIILVGDSLEMVLYGSQDTNSLEIETIIKHAKSVKQATQNALVVCDVPFSYYEQNKEQAFANIAKIIKQTGVDAVKLEGCEEIADTISFLTKRGIAVMGHIGLMPQRIRTIGSYKKVVTSKEVLLEQAKLLEESGVFSIVIENCNPDDAKYVTKNISVPTIGIGAGDDCSGQIAVFEDICGLTPKQPPFAKKYANILEQIKQVASSYAKDVRG